MFSSHQKNILAVTGTALKNYFGSGSLLFFFDFQEYTLTFSNDQKKLFR
jgi:hypothetical protein